MKQTEEDASNDQRMQNFGQEAIKLNSQNSNANVNVHHLHKGASSDIVEEGYGKAARSQGVSHGPCERNGHGNETLADLIGSSRQYCQGEGNLESLLNAKSGSIDKAK